MHGNQADIGDTRVMMFVVCVRSCDHIMNVMTMAVHAEASDPANRACVLQGSA